MPDRAAELEQGHIWEQTPARTRESDLHQTCTKHAPPAAIKAAPPRVTQPLAPARPQPLHHTRKPLRIDETAGIDRACCGKIASLSPWRFSGIARWSTEGSRTPFWGHLRPPNKVIS